jgi:hypothetical protein
MSISFTTAKSSNPNAGVQLAYPLNLTEGHEGMLADLQAYTSRSYRNTTASAIAFGSLVCINTADTTGNEFAIAPVTSASATIVGLNLDTQTYEAASGSSYTPEPSPKLPGGRIGTPSLQTANVLSTGTVWVYTTDTTTKLGDAVRFYITDVDPSIEGAYLGRFCITAVPGKTVQITSGARWVTGANGGNLAQLEIKLPTATYQAD